MHTRLVAAVVVAFATVSHAASYDPRPDRWGISEASVRAHMEFLASDALNGRGSGTRDEWIAAEYIASHLRAWGLEPLGDDGGFVKKVTVERAEITAPPVLAFAGRRATHLEAITVTALGAAKLAGPLQKYKEGTPVAAGAALLLPDTNPPAAALTTAAALVLSLETEPLRARRQGTARGRPLTVQALAGTPKRAAVALDKDTYAAVAALAEGTPIAIEAAATPAPPAHTWNVVGRLTGASRTRAQEVIVLGAHLDHTGARGAAGAPAGTDIINNGADDDASGTTAVLEIARAMARGKRAKRTVVFAWFGSEESGGLGSRHFIEAGPVPLVRMIAQLQFEMIGRPDAKVPPHALWLTGYERSNLGPQLARRGAKLVADPHPEQSFFTRSDNIRFARAGVVAHTVSSFGLHTDYHRPSDEVKTIDFPHMTDAIRSMVKPILWLANSDFKPEWRAGQRP